MSTKKFSELKLNDELWVVYNKNYNDKGQIYELTLSKAIVIDNHPEDNVINIQNRYDLYYNHESMNINFIELSVLDLNKIYQRHYNNNDDERKYLTLSSKNYSGDPYIDVFIYKDDAIDYIKAFCKHTIKMLEYKIQKYQDEININKKCINKLKQL